MIIIPVALGALVTYKAVKTIRKELDFKKLKKYGEEVGMPYLGEAVEEYRATIVKIRNERGNK